MLRNCLSTGCMFGLLLFGMSASAYEYMGTTTIDLTTLRFSGIGTSFTPHMKLTEAFVIGRCPCGRNAVSRQALMEQDGHWADNTLTFPQFRGHLVKPQLSSLRTRPGSHS